MGTQKSKKHIGLYIFLTMLTAFLLFVGIFFLIDYSHYQKDKSPYRTLFIPRLELALFEVTTLTTQKADMVGKVLVHNPLPFNLRADSLRYKIFIGGVEVIKSTYAKSLNIQKWDSSWIELPVTTYTEKLVRVLKAAEKAGEDSIDYEVQTSFGTNLIVHKHFDLNIKKRLPVFYLPDIKMDKLLYDSLNTEGITLILPMTIVNKNKMDFKVKDLHLRFKLADNKWVEGSKPGLIDIKQQAETPLTIPIRISFKEIGKSILPLIKSGRNTDFKLDLTMKLVSDNNAMKNSLIILNDAGTVKEIVKLAKEAAAESKEKKEKQKESGQPEQPKKKIKFEKKKH